MISKKRAKAKSPDSSSQFRMKMATLHNVDILKGIAPEKLKILTNAMELQSCPAGTILLRPEDTTERLYILKKGHVDQYLLTSGGKRLVTRHIESGSVFGIMGLMGQTMQGNFAETTEASTVYIVTRDDVLKLLKQQPTIALNILELVGNRLRLLEELLVKTVYTSVKSRLAEFVLANADPASGILSHITHEEIGDTIGTARQTVTEALGRMRNEGLILTRSKHIQIIDREGLEKIVLDQ